MRLVCRLLGVARSSVLYEARGSSDLQPLKDTVQHVRVTFPTAGFVWMHKFLSRRLRLQCSRSQVRRAYAEMGILGKRAPKRVRTTDSKHEHERYPNALKALPVEYPDQVWVADTTEFKAGGKTVYLALLEDLFTRRVVGYALSRSNNSELTAQALDMALQSSTPKIHHSDQGKTYASARYTKRLMDKNVQISMSAAGCAWENGHAERLNRTVKEQEILRSDYETVVEAKAGIKAYVNLYNELRPHTSLNFQTPNEVLDEFKRRAS